MKRLKQRWNKFIHNVFSKRLKGHRFHMIGAYPVCNVPDDKLYCYDCDEVF